MKSDYLCAQVRKVHQSVEAARREALSRDFPGAVRDFSAALEAAGAALPPAAPLTTAVLARAFSPLPTIVSVATMRRPPLAPQP